MSDNYSKTDIRQIAESFIEDLRECDDGTSMTTAELAKNAGYDDMDFDDLFELHYALFRTIRGKHITLDMSSHDDKWEGVPYDLDFVVHNKKAQIKCPRCGSRNTARIIYGMPAYDEHMQEMLDSGKWALGGCCIGGFKINGEYINIDPTRRCNACKKDFGAAPILITPKKDTIEDYRNIVRLIGLSIGGYPTGYTSITIKKNKAGATVEVIEPISMWKNPSDDLLDDFFEDTESELSDDSLPNRQISNDKWTEIVNALYDRIRLHEWNKKFVRPNVCDGTHWGLEIRLTNGRKRTYYGDNAYPPYFNELLKLMRQFYKDLK